MDVIKKKPFSFGTILDAANKLLDVLTSLSGLREK